ncbi:hypothetical protein IPO96_03985 [Candidatus Saccharibacteria bacterium]|nr:MAG: hypothetical protein IPO96_03985 [Candidatus Saccharibacteria bacterium]
MRGIDFKDGLYKTPKIGPAKRFDDYPQSSIEVLDGRMYLNSVLYDERIDLENGFGDKRAGSFVTALVDHQFHLIDIRQLSMPEKFETRDGAGSMDRLTTLLESAVMAAKLGATFEQIVQVMLSDLNVTIDSHRLGDQLVGDYDKQSARDDKLWDYIRRSGLYEDLKHNELMEEDGRLAGSPLTLELLANPNNPRRHDIIECPRPDGNADRTPFTLIEGLYLVDHKLVRDAADSLVRVEVNGKNGVEERMAFNDVDAARLLYQLSVRHLAEHWGDAAHHIVEELLSWSDKYRFLEPTGLYRDFQTNLPTDHLHNSQSEWYGLADRDSFVLNIQNVAANLATEIKQAMQPVQNDDEVYGGPVKIQGVSIEKSVNRPKPTVNASLESKYDKTGELWVGLPSHKYRAPIDSLVTTKSGLQRVSEIDTNLSKFAEDRLKWLGPYLARIILPASIIKELEYGCNLVRSGWEAVRAQKSEAHPLRREAMETWQLSQQIKQASTLTKQLARS